MHAFSHQPHWSRLAAIALIAWLEFLQNGLLNFASSQVMGGVGAGPEEFSQAAMAYALSAVVALFNHQWCVERFGSRRHLQGSILLFALGALIAGSASSPAGFIAGRAVQGLGGAAFFTAARLEVAQLPPAKRGLGLVAFGQALLLGSALGPLLGGVLLQAYGWRALCWGILPLLLPAWWAAGQLPLRPPAHRPAHYPTWAFMLLLAAAFLLQWLIQQTPYQLFAHPRWLASLAAAAVAALLLFRATHRRQASDRRRWRPLRRPGYRLGLVGYSCCYLLVSANSYILPMLSVQALGFDLPTSGMLLSVSYLAGIAFALLYAKLLLKGKAPCLTETMAYGCLLLAGYGWLMSGLNGEVTLGRVAAILLLNGGFMSLFIMAVAQSAFRGIAPAAFGRAYQTKNIVRQVSVSAGVALASVFMQTRNALHYSRLSERFSWNSPQFLDSLHQLRQFMPDLSDTQRLGVLAGELARQATLVSCLDFFRLESWIGLALAACLLAARKTGRAGAPWHLSFSGKNQIMRKSVQSETFNKIVEASLQLFNQEGERVITTNHIAERMNISTGKLYYHFRNKEEIINELYQRYVKGMADQLSAALSHSNSIEAMVMAMEKTLRHIWSFRFLPKSLPSLFCINPQLEEEHQQLSRGQLNGKLGQLFTRLREQGMILVDDQQLSHLVQHFQMVQTGWISTIKQNASAAELDKLVQNGCRSLMYLLTPYVSPRFQSPFERACARFA